MALDAATLAWINRLGPEPSSSDLGQLRALRRHTTTPSEVRLLDSVLAPIGASDARRTEREAIQRRVAYLESMLQPEQVARADAARRVAEQRLTTALTDPGPQQVGLADAERRASSAARVLGANELGVASELRDLRARIAAIR